MKRLEISKSYSLWLPACSTLTATNPEFSPLAKLYEQEKKYLYGATPEFSKGLN